MTVKINVNSENELVEPELHDAEIFEINTSDLRQYQELKIKLETESKEIFEFTFSHVSHCTLKTLFSQNVVRDIIILKGQSLKDHFGDYVQELGTLESLEESWTILSPMELVHFIPSVGSEVLVLCGGFSIRKLAK